MGPAALLAPNGDSIGELPPLSSSSGILDRSAAIQVPLMHSLILAVNGLASSPAAAAGRRRRRRHRSRQRLSDQRQLTAREGSDLFF